MLTVAFGAARLFTGNFEASWRFVLEHGYLRCRLSRSQFNRHLQQAMPLAEGLFRWLAELWTHTGEESVFVIDSMPFAFAKTRLLRKLAIVNEQDLPVEAHLAPGSLSDTAELKNFALDLPEGSLLYGDKAYGSDYLTEDLLAQTG